jgi:branched-chain amino acid transport system ATP-binding protein
MVWQVEKGTIIRMTENRKPLLEGRGVSKYFGGLAALDRVDFEIYPGEIVGLIGPNGSGKTTLFDCLSRVQNISLGNIYLKN